MTYRVRATWISYADLLAKNLGQRIKYVRENLETEEGRALTQPEFAELVGRKGHHGVMAWEKNSREPQKPVREKLTTITPYPAEAFQRVAVAGASLESVDARLRSLEDTVERQGDAMTSALENLTKRLRAVERALKLPAAKAS